MKQYVTPEQLQELTPKQQEALRKWWKPEPHQLAIDKHGRIAYVYEVERFNNGTIVIWAWMHHSGERSVFGVGKHFFLPLMNIGQCIELLNNKTNEQSFGYNDSGCFWTMFMGNRGIGNMVEGSKGRQFSSYELVDALWIAVKELLQKPL